VVEEAKRVQHKTAAAMDKASKLVNDMEEMGAEANLVCVCVGERKCMSVCAFVCVWV